MSMKKSPRSGCGKCKRLLAACRKLNPVDIAVDFPCEEIALSAVIEMYVPNGATQKQ